MTTTVPNWLAPLIVMLELFSETVTGQVFAFVYNFSLCMLAEALSVSSPWRHPCAILFVLLIGWLLQISVPLSGMVEVIFELDAAKVGF